MTQIKTSTIEALEGLYDKAEVLDGLRPNTPAQAMANIFVAKGKLDTLQEVVTWLDDEL